MHNRNRGQPLIRENPKSCYIHSRGEPYTTGYSQEASFFYMENRVLFQRVTLSFLLPV